MSKISTLIDSLRARVSALFTTAAGYRELTNVREMEENDELFLARAMQ